MTKDNNWIKNLKAGDMIFIHEYSSFSRNAKNRIEVISKIGRKYITTTKNRVIEIATGYERSKITGALVAKIYPNEYEYSNERKLERKHKESCELLKSTKSREYIEAVYEILTGNNGWISVKDGLPHEQGYYLGYCPHWVNPYEILEYDADLGGFLDHESEITYWRYLPVPPKD